MPRRPIVTRREKRKAARWKAWEKRHNARQTVFGYTIDYRPANRRDRKREAKWAKESP